MTTSNIECASFLACRGSFYRSFSVRLFLTVPFRPLSPSLVSSQGSNSSAKLDTVKNTAKQIRQEKVEIDPQQPLDFHSSLMRIASSRPTPPPTPSRWHKEFSGAISAKSKIISEGETKQNSGSKFNTYPRTLKEVIILKRALNKN